jgi:cholest-4-en-3-one 26-monooxygenase
VTGLEEFDLPEGFEGGFGEGANMMLTMDPPEHTRYRKLVNKGFTPRMIGLLESHIRDLAGRIIDGAIAKKSCDFVVDVAAELPLEVIAELLGVPSEDRHKLFDWSNRMIGSEDPEYAVSMEKLGEAFLGMFMYAAELATQRRAEPRDDIVTALLEADVDGERLSEHEFDLFFLLLVTAGNETTRHVISHGTHALLSNPDEIRRLGDDPGLIETAVEEVLRWGCSLLHFRRTATRDHELHERTIREGDKALLWYISANRDEVQFPEPLRFDVGRVPNRHVSFGLGGPHFCLGAHLARLELKIFLQELLPYLPHLELAGEPERLRSNFFHGIKRMPVTYSRP